MTTHEPLSQGGHFSHWLGGAANRRWTPIQWRWSGVRARLTGVELQRRASSARHRLGERGNGQWWQSSSGGAGAPQQSHPGAARSPINKLSAGGGLGSNGTTFFSSNMYPPPPPGPVARPVTIIRPSGKELSRNGLKLCEKMRESERESPPDCCHNYSKFTAIWHPILQSCSAARSRIRGYFWTAAISLCLPPFLRCISLPFQT